MQSAIYAGWALAAPAVLAMICAATSIRAINALGYPLKPAFSQWMIHTLSLLAVFLLWSMVPVPLPIVYVFVSVGRIAGSLEKKGGRIREVFLINLILVLIISLHLILISAIALALHTPMNVLLQQPFWRISTLCVAVLADIGADVVILRHGLTLAVLRAQADSQEVRPFITFLGFCNLFLLLDSILCSLDIQWKLLPLFLLSSTFLLDFYLLRFLKHIYSIMKVHYLEDEHRRLREELRRQEQLEEELRKKGDQDAMTGIYSRGYVLNQMECLIRDRKPFSLAYLDLDKLKQVNDEIGHQAGDRYLVRFARLLEARLRKTDIFARVGGDEFVILLPGCQAANARARMEQTRQSMGEETCFGHRYSFSFGVAGTPEDWETDVEQLVKQADQAMYQDKKRTKH